MIKSGDRSRSRWAGIGALALTCGLFMVASGSAALAQAASSAAMRETMNVGDEPGRVSTAEIVINDGPFKRQLVFFRSNEAPGTLGCRREGGWNWLTRSPVS